MLAYTFRFLGIDIELSFLSAAFFLVDVSHFRAVHWIACMAYPLSLSFSLLTVVLFLRHIQSGGVGWAVLASCLLALGILSHMASVWVVGFCIYLAFRNKKRFVYAVGAAAPLIVVAILLGIWAYTHSLQTAQSEHAAVLGGQVQIVESVYKLIWFAGRLFTYAFVLGADLTSIHAIDWVVGVGFIGIAMVVIWRGDSPLISNWLVWTLLLLTAFVFNPIQTWLANGPSRYLYLASAGTSLFVVWGLRALVSRFFSGVRCRIIFVSVLSAILIFNIYAVKRAEAIAFYLSGRGYVARSEWETGIDVLARAIQHDARVLPLDAFERYSMGCLGLGKSPLELLSTVSNDARLVSLLQMLSVVVLYLDSDVGENGDRMLQMAYEQALDKENFRRNTSVAFNNLASYFYRESNYTKTAILYGKAVDWRPDYDQAFEGLLLALAEEGKSAAIIDLLRDRPVGGDFLEDLAKIIYNTGKKENALELYQQIVVSDPQNADAHYHVGLIYGALGQRTEELNAYIETVENDANHADAWKRLGNLLYQGHNLSGAVKAYREVVRLRPEDKEALRNLGQLLELSGDEKGALEYNQRAMQVVPNNAKN